MEEHLRCSLLYDQDLQACIHACLMKAVEGGNSHRKCAYRCASTGRDIDRCSDFGETVIALTLSVSRLCALC
jgi:hypothetical protein